VSIPPKYGRVYTRINGGVSCKAITFPFLRFRCAHTGKGAIPPLAARKRERERGKGDSATRSARGREDEGGEQCRRQGVGRGAKCVILHALANRARSSACCDRTITSALIINHRLVNCVTYVS